MVGRSKALDQASAVELLGFRMFSEDLKTRTMQDREVEHQGTRKILGDYIAAQNAKSPDIWQARDVTLTNNQKLTPVVVGIWDSGVDTTLFPDQLYTDPNPGWHNSHGPAYDNQGFPSKDLLYPLTEKEQQRYPVFLSANRGFNDLMEGVDSPDAAALRKNPAMQLGPEDPTLDHYAHGTHVAGIALRGNPAARLVVLRFTDINVDIFRFPPTKEWISRTTGDIQQMADYCREKKVRVVNISWLDDVDEIETWLIRTGSKVSPEERK
jgi:hypothetical protein